MEAAAPDRSGLYSGIRNDLIQSFDSRVRNRNRGDQHFCIRMQRIGIELICICDLHEISKIKHPDLITDLLDHLQLMADEQIGQPVFFLKILKHLDDLGLHIVADDVAAQSRQYRTDVPAGDDALTALAQKFADMDNCSVLYNAAKPRVQWIVDTAKARGAKGVLVALTKFCDPEEFDYVMIKKACEAAGIPVTVVEIDRQMVQFEQARTNIETFRDMLTM